MVLKYNIFEGSVKILKSWNEYAIDQCGMCWWFKISVAICLLLFSNTNIQIHDGKDDASDGPRSVFTSLPGSSGASTGILDRKKIYKPVKAVRTL